MGDREGKGEGWALGGGEEDMGMSADQGSEVDRGESRGREVTWSGTLNEELAE